MTLNLLHEAAAGPGHTIRESKMTYTSSRDSMKKKLTGIKHALKKLGGEPFQRN